MAYVTVDDYKQYAKIDDATAADEAEIQIAIDAAVDFLHAATWRTFEESELQWRVHTTRGYPDKLYLEADLLSIDTIGSIASLSSIAGVIAGTETLDEIYDDVVPVSKFTPPYHELARENDTFDPIVMIKGTWGYSLTCPDDVKQAVLAQAKHFYDNRGIYGEGGLVPVAQMQMTIMLHAVIRAG
jgi:hypothetical protein